MIYSLRKTIRAELKNCCANTYYRRAEKSAPFPRCVFSADIFDDDGTRRGVLYVDLYDDIDDTERLEMIAHDIRAAFDHKVVRTTDGTYAFYFDRGLPLEDDDKRLNRRQLQFDLRIYER